MGRSIPQIAKYMTQTPKTARPSLTLDEAMQLMQTSGIRHLPIFDGGKLVGIMTERAIRIIESLNGADLKKIRVEEAMEQSVYVVPPNAGLDEVVMGMTSRRYGSAVVMRNREVLGVFTLADACVAYVDLLNMRPASA